jgi:hypothetical protein
MSASADLGRFFEAWLHDDEADALPEHVLRAVADDIQHLRQRSPMLAMASLWRFAIVPGSLAMAIAISVAGYLLWQPVPPATASPSATPSATFSPAAPTPTETPYEYLFTPAPTTGQGGGVVYTKPVRFTSGHLTVRIAPRGWHVNPGREGIAIMRALIDLEGGSLGAYVLVPSLTAQWPISQPVDAFSANLPGQIASAGPEAIMRLRFVSLPAGGLLEEARAEARGLYDGSGRVEGPIDLTAGPAYVVRTLSTSDSYRFEVLEYVVQLDDQVALLTFGTSLPIANLSAEFRRIANSLSIVARN